MSDVSNGAERTRAWPRDRGKSLHPKTVEQMEWFRQAQWATKYMDPKMLVIFSEATKGTPLLPRDMATMMFAGRLFSFQLSDGRKVYSVQVLNDVSESLDVITQTEGDQLIRGPQYWEGVPRIIGNRAGTILSRSGTLNTVTANVPVTIPWQVETIDQLAAWNIAAPNNIVITIPGWYQVQLQGFKQAQAVNTSDMFILMNGVLQSNTRNTQGVAGIETVHNQTAILNCPAGAIITGQIRNAIAGGVWSGLSIRIVGNA